MLAGILRVHWRHTKCKQISVQNSRVVWKLKKVFLEKLMLPLRVEG